MADKGKPIDPDKVSVDVTPVEKPVQRNMSDSERSRTRRQNENNKKHAEIIEKGLNKEVKEAVEQSADQGRQAQQDAAKAPVERVLEDVPPDTIEKIDIKIDGDTITVTPDK